MHSISFQQNTGFPPATMINRNQPDPADKHDRIRAAVRAWSASLDNQDVVAGIIVEEWERQGGAGLDFPGDLSRKRQKLFRWLDSDTGYPHAPKLEQEEASPTRRAATSAEARQRQSGKGAAGCSV